MEQAISLEEFVTQNTEDGESFLYSEADGSVASFHPDGSVEYENVRTGKTTTFSPCDKEGKFRIDNGSAHQEFDPPDENGKYLSFFGGLNHFIPALGRLEKPMTRFEMIEAVMSQ